ncbi:MAG: hypothetical protein ACE5QF_07690 [Thermoplasmata archaeon]
MDVETLDSSEIELVLPDDVLSAVEKFALATIDGLERLREDFPEHTGLIDAILDIPEKVAIKQYFDELVSKFEGVKHDRSFMEAFAMVFVSAILGQASVKDSLLLPLTEYFESTAASKAFLRSPFLCARIPPGGGTLSCQLESRDVLMNECGAPLTIETRLTSQEEAVAPLKDIVQIRRL